MLNVSPSCPGIGLLLEAAVRQLRFDLADVPYDPKAVCATDDQLAQSGDAYYPLVVGPMPVDRSIHSGLAHRTELTISPRAADAHCVA